MPRVNLLNVVASCGLYNKSFTIVIYDCNDRSQYNNTVITIVSYAPNLTLALASVVNYDHKCCSKQMHNFQWFIYDRKTFIVQTTGGIGSIKSGKSIEVVGPRNVIHLRQIICVPPINLNGTNFYAKRKREKGNVY